MKTEIFWVIVMMILAILLLSQVFISLYTQAICRAKCIKKEGIYFKRIPDGIWFSARDYCICLYNNKTYEKFRLK